MVSVSLFKEVATIQYTGNSHAKAIITVSPVQTHAKVDIRFFFILHESLAGAGIE